MRRLGAIWVHLGAYVTRLGAILGRLGAILGASWPPKTRSRSVRDLSKYLVFPLVFQCFCDLTLLDRLGAVLERLGGILGRLGASLARLGAILSRLGAILKRLGAILARLGRVLASQNLPKIAPRPLQKTCFSLGFSLFL